MQEGGAERIAAVVELLYDQGTSGAQTFFVAHGLGNAFGAAGRGWGRRKRINDALLQAENDGRLAEILQSAESSFGPRRSPPVQARSEAPQARGARMLFISHASADRELAEALVRMLRLGTSLGPGEIVCTSLPGMGVPQGVEDYLGYLREHLESAQFVLPLLTPAFFESETCLIELGAMWGTQQERFLLMVPSITYERVERLLGKHQLGRIDSSTVLSELHDRVNEAFRLTPQTPMWDESKREFLDDLPGLLSRVSPPARVAREAYDAAVESIAAKDELISSLKGQLIARDELVQRLRVARTPTEAEEALVESDEEANFSRLWDEASEAARGVAPLVRQALYDNIGLNRDFAPEHEDLTEAERLLESGVLELSSRGAFVVDESDDDVKRAVHAIEALFDHDWSNELLASIKNNHLSGKAFKRSSRPVWRSLDLLESM